MGSPESPVQSGSAAPKYRHLLRSDIPMIVRHLLGLSLRDRQFRFNAPHGDAAIRQYCAAIPWRNAHLFGFVVRGELRGLIELDRLLGDRAACYEAAITVAERYRRRGIGAKLLSTAADYASHHGYTCLLFEWHPENREFAAFLSACGGVIQSYPQRGCLPVPRPPLAGACDHARRSSRRRLAA